ncbi:hypothetical protein BDV59DRAFT_120259 [Aspergillus ambiguus]|uniref:uncharacterized protein n=1 Tax=Aspergillus ambiguus TaxID=176160 RepID=UPI003CCD7FB3
MPIKLPKSFARRKSAGNALEDVEPPPQSSFRVFERPSVDRKSFSEGNLLSKRFSEAQPLYSTPEDHDNIFADHHPKDLHRESYENSSSVRFSSSFPRRSTDGPVPADAQSPHTRNLHDIPIPPISGALRAAGRTFSFGGRFSKSSAPIPPPQQSTPAPARGRAMTATSDSTATPPKLLDTDLHLGQLGDDFHNMFDDLGKSESTTQQSSARNRSVDTYSSSPPENPSQRGGKAPRPAPIKTDHSKDVEPSPYSWDSQHSEEGLLNPVESPQAASVTPPPVNHYPSERRKSLPLSNVPSTTYHRSLERPNPAAERGLRRSVLYPTKRDSASVEDEDARLVRQSLYSNRRSSQPLVASSPEDSDDTPLFGNGQNLTANRSKSTGPVMEDQTDLSIAAHAQLAAQYEERQPAQTASGNKIMTPSQFEHYRQQQALRRSNSDASSKSDNSAGSEFDEEDEAEQNREAERLRRKQEAHLSVYRQQMMKVTGQEAPAPSLRPEMERASNSAPNLTVPSINGANQSGSNKSSEGDDDEEVPLGILAAHGFPNRNRPPSRLNPSSSNPNLRASFQQPYISSAGSVAGHESGNRSSLPVFARNLPRDPYLGASLVNPSNRESLALGGGASVYGGPSGPPTSLPPGGLVGVIATEERARAMRRGSPNTQAMYEYQNAVPTAPMHPSGVPRPYTMMSMYPPNMSSPQGGVSATEQAQIQLSQQMSNMMQMQMQWMQQMMQMQGGQGPPPSLVPPMPNMRPSSMPSAGSVHNAPLGYPNDQRTLSMLDPNASSRLNSPMPFASGGLRPGTPHGQGYAPSIAPSERSTVGMASRYRPVSTVPPEADSAYHYVPKPWNDENHRSPPSITSHMSKSTVRPMSAAGQSILAVRSPPAGLDDDDDDQGWAEMMKKREKKRSNWKMKKEATGFGDLLNAVH